MKLDIESLIKTASKKLGMPEDKLREAVRTGNASGIKSYLNPADRAKLDKAMNDRELAEKIKKQYTGS